MTSTELHRLRARVLAHSLFPKTTLPEAIERLGFVQADPIRAPARAQDLILRHRVSGYRINQLERDYPDLDLEEGILYAYGFMPRATWHCLHGPAPTDLSVFDKRVLSVVRKIGPAHPRALDDHIGRERGRNDWGGTSAAGKRALEALHGRGLLRVHGRAKGVRVYAPAPPRPRPAAPKVRMRELAAVVTNTLAPAPRRQLRTLLSRIGRSRVGAGAGGSVLEDLLRAGTFEEHVVDGVPYVVPVGSDELEEIPDRVRFLTPFDPVTWDRTRFEHLWGWAYRFEAYTPARNRVRGYYAMPLLWRDAVIGWVNLGVTHGALAVEAGFVKSRPRSLAFKSAFDAEVSAIEAFLGV